MFAIERRPPELARVGACPAGGSTLQRTARVRGLRAGQRGAVLIESVLVISVLLLSLIGTVFVARIYQVTLRAVGVSRAAAIGYSFRACKAEDAGTWFNKDETALLTNWQAEDSGAPTVTDVKSEEAQRAVAMAARSGTFGSPRLMSTTAGGEVFGPLLDPNRIGGIFHTKVAANDHVLCGEIEHRRGVLGLLGFARDFFKF